LEQAETLLLDRLGELTEDPRMIPALLQIGPSPRGLNAMREALGHYPKNHTGVALATALWRLNQDEAALEKLIATATKSGREDRRMAAINALGTIAHPQADATLLQAIQNDEDELIPTAAESLLLSKHGLEGYRTHPLILRLTRELSHSDPALREAAHAALSDLITAVREGISPNALGLSS
jgi:HEAT repeat protein